MLLLNFISVDIIIIISTTTTTWDVPVIHSVLGIYRVSHYSVLLGLCKIISLSKFNFLKVKY